MEDRVRLKGRFIKKKMLDKQLKFKKMRCEKKLSASDARDAITSKTTNITSGRRIVELDELAKNLKCCQCSQVLSLENIVNEKRMGLRSILTVRCQSCSSMTAVSTGKTHRVHEKNEHLHSDVNTKAVFGTLHAGIGCDTLNKVLACLNIPVISKDLFKRYEQEVGPAIERAAKESCERVAEEERQLVLENIEKLCSEL
ncbi:uncharacterized protein [Venturia canescens]|uniref:uncharacterized protein n=1 Tax=Venturia canescens TaxID=32260 RepID=UPI001C9D6004|nr:uncharacterized protein LOC122416044 [Venturia canescens]